MIGILTSCLRAARLWRGFVQGSTFSSRDHETQNIAMSNDTCSACTGWGAPAATLCPPRVQLYPYSETSQRWLAA
jgi:hypothetical protein